MLKPEEAQQDQLSFPLTVVSQARVHVPAGLQTVFPESSFPRGRGVV